MIHFARASCHLTNAALTKLGKILLTTHNLTSDTHSSSRNILFVRRPPLNFASGLITHISAPQHTSYDKAIEEWESYIRIFQRYSWKVIEVLPPSTSPDCHFIEDTCAVFESSNSSNGHIAVVINSMGAQSRQIEITAIREALCREVGSLGNQLFDRIEYVRQGNLDGGDILKVPSSKTVYVGLTTRTTLKGIAELREILSREGYAVVAVPTTKVLHLKSCVTALPCGTIIGYEPLVDDTSIFGRFLSVPEASGSHVVILDGSDGGYNNNLHNDQLTCKQKTKGHLLMSASAPKSKVMLEELGYHVETVDISNFEKLEGCVTCLSVRVRKPGSDHH